jgi:arylsulfatase A-like enzyme
VSGSRGPMLNPDLIPDYQRHGGSNDAAGYIARYDGELRFVDTEIGKLLDGLAANGQLARTLIVVIGDHGENLVEHGYYFDHGNELYMEAVHVPLVIAGPGVPADGRRVRGIVRTPDVMPTLLDLVGVTAPKEEVDGRSLLSALSSGDVAPPREVCSEARLVAARPLTPFSDVTPKVAVRDDRFTVMWREATWKLELYDRAADPEEKRNLFAGRSADREEDELRTSLRAKLQARLAALTRGVMLQTQVITPDVADSAVHLLARRGASR